MERLEKQSAASNLDRIFGFPKEQVNASSSTPNGQVKDSDSLSQAEVSVASTCEEGAGAEAEAIGGQQQKDLHEDLDTSLTHTADGFADSDQVPDDIVEATRTKTLDDTRALPLDFGKSSLGSGRIFTSFEQLTDGQRFLRLDG